MGMMTKPTKDNMIGFIMSSRAMRDNNLKTNPEWWKYIRSEYEKTPIKDIQVEFDFYMGDFNH
jgi:hypothetical protein